MRRGRSRRIGQTPSIKRIRRGCWLRRRGYPRDHGAGLSHFAGGGGKVWRQLGQGEIEDAAKQAFLTQLAWGGLKAGTKFGEPAPLFPRAEKDTVERMQNLEDQNSKSVIEAASGQESAAKSAPEAPPSALAISPIPEPPAPTVAPAHVVAQ